MLGSFPCKRGDVLQTTLRPLGTGGDTDGSSGADSPSVRERVSSAPALPGFEPAAAAFVRTATPASPHRNLRVPPSLVQHLLWHWQDTKSLELQSMPFQQESVWCKNQAR